MTLLQYDWRSVTLLQSGGPTRRHLDRADPLTEFAELAAGYAAEPSGADERSWAELSVEGLRTADLEW